MLPTTLNTNEVKNSAGTEEEFQRKSTDHSSLEFAKISETPYLPHRLVISHQEIGSGLKARRRSRVGVRKTVLSSVDNVTPVQIIANVTLDSPTGAIATNAEPKNVMANLLSFCASSGASTTILYDGTGNGTAAMLDGTL